MNKSELIAVVADKAALSKAAAGRAVDAALDAITEQLSGGESVALTGFGTFATAERAARQGRNPQTGESIEIAASVLPKFKPGKGLKDAVNS